MENRKIMKKNVQKEINEGKIPFEDIEKGETKKNGT